MNKKYTPWFNCPSCNRKIRYVYDSNWLLCSGRWVECSYCNKKFVICWEAKITAITAIESSVQDGETCPEDVPKNKDYGVIRQKRGST